MVFRTVEYVGVRPRLSFTDMTWDYSQLIEVLDFFAKYRELSKICFSVSLFLTLLVRLFSMFITATMMKAAFLKFAVKSYCTCSHVILSWRLKTMGIISSVERIQTVLPKYTDTLINNQVYDSKPWLNIGCINMTPSFFGVKKYTYIHLFVFKIKRYSKYCPSKVITFVHHVSTKQFSQ